MTEVFAKILETENLENLLEEMIEKENWSVHSVQHMGTRQEAYKKGSVEPPVVWTKAFIYASRYMHS